MKNIDKKIYELRIGKSDTLKKLFDADSQEYVGFLEKIGFVLLIEPVYCQYKIEIYLSDSLEGLIFSSGEFIDINMSVADLIKKLEKPFRYFQDEFDSLFTSKKHEKLQALLDDYQIYVESEIKAVKEITHKNSSSFREKDRIDLLTDDRGEYITSEICKKIEIYLDTSLGRFQFHKSYSCKFLFPRFWKTKPRYPDLVQATWEDSKIILEYQF